MQSGRVRCDTPKPVVGPTRDQLLEMVQAGVQAPSADNRHRIRFEISNDGLTLCADGDFTATTDPHRRILTLVSIGAVIENILLKARELGWACEIASVLDRSKPGSVAEIRCKGAMDTPRDQLCEAIARRHTNRRFYRGPRLDTQDVAGLESEANGVEGARIRWLDGSIRAKALRLVLMAETERFRNRTLHAELFSAIRFDVGWHASCDEGLPPGALEVEPPMRALFKAMRHWRVMRMMNIAGAARMLGFRAAYLPCRLSPHLGIIGTTLDLEHGAIAAGRAFQRLWLSATLLDLAIQPLVASALFALPVSIADGPPDRMRVALRKGWEEIAPGMTPMIVFRLGRAGPPTVTSSRKKVDAYVTPLP